MFIITPIGDGVSSVELDGETIITSSRQPIVDLARILLRDGADPSTQLQVKLASGEIVQSGAIGIVAARRRPPPRRVLAVPLNY
jgi:hypothetical protein